MSRSQLLAELRRLLLQYEAQAAIVRTTGSPEYVDRQQKLGLEIKEVYDELWPTTASAATDTTIARLA